MISVVANRKSMISFNYDISYNIMRHVITRLYTYNDKNNQLSLEHKQQDGSLVFEVSVDERSLCKKLKNND